MVACRVARENERTTLRGDLGRFGFSVSNQGSTDRHPKRTERELGVTNWIGHPRPYLMLPNNQRRLSYSLVESSVNVDAEELRTVLLFVEGDQAMIPVNPTAFSVGEDSPSKLRRDLMLYDPLTRLVRFRGAGL